MREALDQWIGKAEALHHLNNFKVHQISIDFDQILSRTEDYYISLVGALFDCLRTSATDDAAGWVRIGNALAELAQDAQAGILRAAGISISEAKIFAATAFYCGGFPASAYLIIKNHMPGPEENDVYSACFDLLARSELMRSSITRELTDALRRGDGEALNLVAFRAGLEKTNALQAGPKEWIASVLLERLITRFQATNVRSVLPDGESEFWTPLVESFLDRNPPSWEFFPSQIQAIERGLLSNTQAFSLQMPTGAGKTTLCETLLYWHAKIDTSAIAVLLVPYRSLAAELRTTLVRRLNAMGISARCAYGGTVPTGDEARSLADVRVLIATPEALSGLLGTNERFLHRLSLVICDEGHLLDSDGRGVGLELLIARMQSRESGPPRFVFVSAIVPNIEEINAWLGGMPDTVVRSNYRPALAEFALLRPLAESPPAIALDIHPHENPPIKFTISDFLTRDDFQWLNHTTRRRNTYSFGSLKAQAVAAARKALIIGTVAVFAANKRGNQGAIGLAEELLSQLRYELPLPNPAPFAYANRAELAAAIEYLTLEYGAEWIATKTLASGAALHHGDIPQETREVLETLIREGIVRFVICTSTLAEGVNLPIRTLVLYSVERKLKGGAVEQLLTRDIKNLVGRAGRAGATTKGLVICANERQWPLVEQVALQASGEAVQGELLSLISRLRNALISRNLALTNQILESTPVLHALTDGVDSTLIDLATEEIGEEEFVQLAMQIADQTFASRQADAPSKALLREVFTLRARRVTSIRSAGRLNWIRETGTRARILDSVEQDLLPRRASWDDIESPVDPALMDVLLNWAWNRAELQNAIQDGYRIQDGQSTDMVKGVFFQTITLWLQGSSFAAMADQTGTPLDDLLSVHARALTFALQTLIEQAIALLGKLLEAQGQQLAPAIAEFPEHLRFGVPTVSARILSAHGVRHRSAAVALGYTPAVIYGFALGPSHVPTQARAELLGNRENWINRLGLLVVNRTEQDLS